MPKPKPGEDRKSYLQRAVRMMIHEEGLKPMHAVAKAYGMWREHVKKRRGGR